MLDINISLSYFCQIIFTLDILNRTKLFKTEGGSHREGGKEGARKRYRSILNTCFCACCVAGSAAAVV